MPRKYDPVRLVQGVVNVASLPTIYTKIEAAVHDEKTSSQDIAKLVSEDTALAAKVLRLANSAMYNFPSKISAITQAVTIIGTRQLKDLVLAASVTSVFKDMPSDLVDMESFWRHSIASAVAARLLSQLRRDSNSESAFVAGLLHDIGRLIMFKELGPQMLQCCQRSQTESITLDLIERESFGFDHALLGGMLLKEWKLPPQLVESTQFHHSPSRSMTYPVEASYVHIANIIVTMLQFGNSGDPRVPKLDHGAWASLGFQADIVDTLVDDVKAQYNSAVEFILGAAA